jgi:hypothetical protein
MTTSRPGAAVACCSWSGDPCGPSGGMAKAEAPASPVAPAAGVGGGPAAAPFACMTQAGKQTQQVAGSDVGALHPTMPGTTASFQVDGNWQVNRVCCQQTHQLPCYRALCMHTNQLCPECSSSAALCCACLPAHPLSLDSTLQALLRGASCTLVCSDTRWMPPGGVAAWREAVGKQQQQQP